MKEYYTIVIPVKNEEKNLAILLPIVSQYASELIIVDGHSTDESLKIAERYTGKIYMDDVTGKGQAMRTAIPHITKPITVFMDADQSHNPADIEKLIYPIVTGRCDHVSGSRMLGGSDELHGDINKFMRMIGSDIITMGINYRFGIRLTDSQNGFRAIRTDLLRKLDLKENITTIEQELIMKTLLNGYRLGEVSTHEYLRPFGESKIILKKVFVRYIYSWLKYLLQPVRHRTLLSQEEEDSWKEIQSKIMHEYGDELTLIYSKWCSQIDKMGFAYQRSLQ